MKLALQQSFLTLACLFGLSTTVAATDTAVEEPKGIYAQEYEAAYKHYKETDLIPVDTKHFPRLAGIVERFAQKVGISAKAFFTPADPLTPEEKAHLTQLDNIQVRTFRDQILVNSKKMNLLRNAQDRINNMVSGNDFLIGAKLLQQSDTTIESILFKLIVAKKHNPRFFNRSFIPLIALSSGFLGAFAGLLLGVKFLGGSSSPLKEVVLPTAFGFIATSMLSYIGLHLLRKKQFKNFDATLAQYDAQRTLALIKHELKNKGLTASWFPFSEHSLYQERIQNLEKAA